MNSIDKKTLKFINAVKANLINTAKKLLNEGVCVNATDGNMNVALAYVKSVEMLKVLLDNGANINAKNREMDSVLTIFVKRMDRVKWNLTQFPEMSPIELSKIWDVIKKRGVDTTAVNLDNKKAKYYVDMNDPAQRAIGAKICVHEGHMRMKQGEERRAAMKSLNLETSKLGNGK